MEEPAAATEAPARLMKTPAGVKLGPLSLIANGAARNFVLHIGDAYFHGFVVRRGDEAFGYVDRCPHMGLPLAQKLDGYMTAEGSLITCSWHGALFTSDAGLCVGGPCTGARLTPWPVIVDDGVLKTT